tara:strand:+ start:4362 stop:4760 length:399 start_codon:yes stop_codon:yes gene_type:complete
MAVIAYQSAIRQTAKITTPVRKKLAPYIIHFVSLSEGINTTNPGGRLVFHIFSAVAEFQREIIVENTTAGLNAARRKGTRLGRPPKLTLDEIAEAHRQIMQGRKDMGEVAGLFDVHPRTVERAFEREGLKAA